MITIKLIILACLSIIGYFGVSFSKTDDGRFLFGWLMLFSTAIVFILLLTTMDEKNNLLKQRGKCPEYEKLENVYKLK